MRATPGQGASSGYAAGYEMNGEPLPAMHGYPLRLLVPGWYGMNSIKWLVGIKVIDHKFDGFYQTERYMVMNGPERIPSIRI